MSNILKSALVGASLLAVAACGGSGADEPVAFENGQGDTGWVQSGEEGTFRLDRKLNQLSVGFELSRNSAGPTAMVRAAAAPCLNGAGEQEVEESFTPETYDDASMMADVSDRLEGVISRIGDRCDVSEELERGVLEGFGGQFFRAADQRAAIIGE